MVEKYVRQQLANARDHMARSHKRQRDRIKEAYELYLVKLQTKDFPKGCQADFQELKRLVSTRSPRFKGEGRLASTMAQMNWPQLHRCADLIVDLAQRTKV